MAADRYLPHPNQRVEITASSEEFRSVYFARVEDVKEEAITVVCPMSEGEVVPLRTGMSITLTYVRDRALLTFDTLILDRTPGEVPRLRLALPEEIVRVQRRSHLRMSARFAVMYAPVEADHDLKSEVQMYRAESVDISAGGLRIRLIDVLVGIRCGSYVRVMFSLPRTEARLNLMSQVIRIEKSDPGAAAPVPSSEAASAISGSALEQIEDTRGKYRLALRFADISQATQDSIMRFVFDRERELIERGIVQR